MALDPRFVVTSDLEELFRDKDSGEPLSGGIVTFYSDLNRTIKKPVYQLTGSPPNYTYAVLQNPITLSDVGTFQDSLGNNIVPYYFPYEGVPDDQNNTLELYYITVESSGLVPQFTRQGWPNFTTESTATSADDKNFLPNGQFLAHNDIVSAIEPPVTVIPFGTGTLDSQAIAQGGWSFRRTTGGTSVFTNSFTTAPVLGGFGLNDFPRYAFNFVCTSFNSIDAVRDLTISWPNVNTFSAGSQPYTFFFNATSKDGNSYLFNVYLIQYYGTGGVPTSPTSTLLETITIGNGYQPHAISIASFPSAALATLGTNNDDYVALAIRGPSESWNVQLTDFALVLGNIPNMTIFPIMTNAEMLDEGVAGWMPTPSPTGSDLYCPLVLTPTGMTFDHSSIGSIEGLMINSTSQAGNLLYCDGSSYLASDYSSLGIPYSRLRDVLYNSNKNGTLFGTGVNFVNANISTFITSELILTTNLAGSQSVPVDTGATGFNMAPTVTSANAGVAPIGYRAYANQFGVVTAIATSIGSITLGTSAGTSTMVITDLVQTGMASTYFSFQIAPVTAAALITGGTALYFDFSTTSVNYRMWFKVLTEVAPAAGGRTLIQCNIQQGTSSVDVGLVIASRLSGFQNNGILVNASPPASSYFNFYANAVTYYVWYKVDGSGTAPVQPAAQLIEVDISSSDTFIQITNKTQIAINSHYFAVPDLRGYFLRGVDIPGNVDTGNASRYAYYANSSSYVGTYQLDSYTQHHHGLGNTATGGAASVGSTGSGNFTATAGSFETRPVNASINYFIRY